MHQMFEKGKFITFEGIEGTGKSTQVRLLKAFLDQKNIPTLLLREPGITYIGEQIRNLLKNDQRAENMYPETELLLFEASRAQLVREILLPELEQGTWILCDRFYDSSTAYQGSARKLPREIVYSLNKFASKNLTPDLTILLDLDPKLAFQRLQMRSDKKDRIEKESLEFFHSVQQEFLSLADREKDRFFIVNATLSIKTLSNIINNCISERFKV